MVLSAHKGGPLQAGQDGVKGHRQGGGPHERAGGVVHEDVQECTEGGGLMRGRQGGEETGMQGRRKKWAIIRASDR